MYGVRDLLLHIMYVNKREKIEPLKFFSADKVVFLALTACYRNGHDIQYDLMFEKSAYGAKGNVKLIKNEYKTFNRTLNLDCGKRIKELEEDKELDNIIINLIKIANGNFRRLPQYIIGSELYQKDIEEIERVKEENAYFQIYPYWTKKEIVAFFDKEGKVNSKIDSRIPLNSRLYPIMKKFLEYGDDFNKKVEFTRSEIMEIHNMPYHLIRSIEENGCYHESKLD